MLIPRFSIRSLLLVTTVCALVFLVFRLALKEHSWAVGLSVTILCMVGAFVLYGSLFLVSLAVVRFTSLAKPPERHESPFATDRLPPQVIPPRQVDENA